MPFSVILPTLSVTLPFGSTFKFKCASLRCLAFRAGEGDSSSCFLGMMSNPQAACGLHALQALKKLDTYHDYCKILWGIVC